MSRIVILWNAAVLFLCGCGGGHPGKTSVGPPPPIAVKDLHFGAPISKVEQTFKPLEKRSEAFGRSIYTHIPPARTAIAAYNFEFLDQKLATCTVVYRAPEFDRLIGRDKLFQRIRAKYGARQDLGSSKGKWRWFNMENAVTITWIEDFQRKIDTLTVTWNKMDEVRQARFKAMLRKARKKQRAAPAPPSPAADVGI